VFKLWWPLSYSTKEKEEIVITPKMKRRIKRTLSAERSTVHIGKAGATTQILNEVAKQLDTREMIKAKILKSALKDEEAKRIASKIAEKTDAELVEVRGHTFLLYKPKTREG
jgi:RNA-binding protein